MIVAAALILDKYRNILMAQRNRATQCPGLWEMPGGKTEPDESPNKAVERELQEEMDIKIDVLDLVTCAKFDFGTPFEFALFHARIAAGTPKAMVHQAGIRYVPLDHAVDFLPCCPTTYVCYRAIKDFLRKV